MKLFPAVALVILIFINEATFSKVNNNPDRNKRRNNNNNNNNDNVVATGGTPATRPEHPPCASNRQTCQNFNVDVATTINNQIREELNASYIYQSMGAWFGRDDQALRGFSKFFYKASDEEREHAQKLIDYMNKRGGILALHNIRRPHTTDWGSGLQAVTTALEMEQFINDKLLDLHWLAQEKNDPHLTNFLESEYLAEQVDSIKQFSDFRTILTRMTSNPLGEHIFDQELYEGKR